MKVTGSIGLPLVFSFMCTFYMQGQIRKRTIDSLMAVTEQMADDTLKVGNYGKLFELLQFSDPKLAYGYSRKALDLAKRLGYKKGLASAHFQMADYYRGKGEIDSARMYYDKAEDFATAANSLIAQLFINHSRGDLEKAHGNYRLALEYIQRNIEIYNQTDTIYRAQSGTFNLIGSEYEAIGSIHKELGNYQIALSETLKALHFFVEKKDTLREADALMQLGVIEALLDNHVPAIEYGKRAYEVYDRYGDKQYKAYAANNIGGYYTALKQTETAKLYFEQALLLAKEIENKEIEAHALTSLGGAHYGLNQRERAKSLLNEGLDIYRALDYKNEVAATLNQLAEIEIGERNYNNAMAYLTEAVGIAKKIDSKSSLGKAYSLKSLAHKNMGRHALALEDFEMFKAVQDSIFNSRKSQQIEELRAIYDSQKKEQQIAQKDLEISLLEERERANNLQKWLLGVGLALSLIALGFGFFGLRQKMKRSTIEKEKLDAELRLKESELAFKKKELTSHALHLAKKNEVLEQVKQKARELRSSENREKGYQELVRAINFDQQDDRSWERFIQYFEQVHKDFNKKIKERYPDITKNELRLMALLKMGLSTKEIATILNISFAGVKKARNRLRKKLGIAREASLEAVIISL